MSHKVKVNMPKQLIVFFILLFSYTSKANINWIWDIGVAHGALITDGTLQDTHNFNEFEVLDFVVSYSFIESNPQEKFYSQEDWQGFLWNGDNTTLFFSHNIESDQSHYIEKLRFVSSERDAYYSFVAPPTSSYAYYDRPFNEGGGGPILGAGTIKLTVAPSLFSNDFE